MAKVDLSKGEAMLILEWLDDAIFQEKEWGSPEDNDEWFAWMEDLRRKLLSVVGEKAKAMGGKGHWPPLPAQDNDRFPA
jgi:hypothetical protein